MIEIEGHVVDRKTMHFEPEKFEDYYEAAIRACASQRKCRRWVKLRRTHCEQMFSGLPRITDIDGVLARSPASKCYATSGFPRFTVWRTSNPSNCG
jgi:non-homologous end joining protein Ku